LGSLVHPRISQKTRTACSNIITYEKNFADSAGRWRAPLTQKKKILPAMIA